ncbi:MAG: tRNA pseudouridine(38-40) synthase TruA [SAR324 cluster bacterium]|nr:tRNA pseudouridine(38-40) synthase TruA [SAR324 cluster bacterium]
MLLAYEGSQFQGWQIQPHGPTVQGKLEEVLELVVGTPVRVYGSGRTDSGVHAMRQVANFRVPENTDLSRLRASLNGLGAPAISVQEVIPVAESFHARHSAIGKTYRYHLFNRPYPPVFARQRCWWIRTPLDVEAMRRATAPLLGTHDFSAFRAKECAARSPIRQIERLEISEEELPDSTLRIEIEASGFLQHMARIIVGTLTAVGLGKLTPEDIPAILAGREREDADATAPGRGLHLLHVNYDLSEFPELRALESATAR